MEEEKKLATTVPVDNNLQSHQQSLKDRIMASIMNSPDDEDVGDKDICRVCRLSGEGALYHPCLCTGSIKYVHQDCLLQWLKYSKKDVCELCNHKFSFRPLYRPDMPERLPIWDLLRGVFLIMARFMRLTLTYTLVVTCWLGLVPLMAARTHRLVFSGLLSSFFSSRILQLFSTENVAIDIARGSLVLTLFLCTFISLVWLREQIMIGGPAHILHLPEEPQPNNNGEENTDQQTLRTAEEVQQIDPGPSVSDVTQTNEDENQRKGQDEPPQKVPTEIIDAEEEEPIPSTSSGPPPQQQSRPIPPLQHFQPVQHSLITDEEDGGNSSNQPANNEDQQIQQDPAAVAEPPAPQQVQAVQPAENNANNDANAQNAAEAADLVEQQRFVDELTWQRLLGLDGSFAFVEHVFWTISLNIVYNVVFLYFPAQIGAGVLTAFGLGPGKIQYFELPISILAGNFVILLLGVVIHRLAKMLRLKNLYTTAGMVCLMLKVFMLVITELVLFPILCGWWLDICSLPLTGVTLDERMRNFRHFPSSSLFLHWLAGMVCVFYSASFILILRELLRPGVLWFIRNLHDPDFNPIQEMIEQPVTHHIRRLIASITLFFSIIMLVVYIPLRMIKWLHPSTLPYVFTGSADTPLVEYSFELVLLQVIMPTLLEYSKAFSLLKRIVRLWCRVVGGWLQLDSYLLPAEKDKQDAEQRERQRQRARERLMRGDQEEQIGLLEALDAIEDDTTDDEDGEEGNDEEDDGGEEVHGENEDDGNIIAPEEEAMELEPREESTTSAPETINNNNLNGSNITQESNSISIPSNENAPPNEEEHSAPEVEAIEPQQQIEVINDDENGQQANNMEENEQPQEQAAQVQQQQQQRLQDQRNLGAQHHALLRFRDVTTAEDYVRPNMFPLRITLLLFFVCLTAATLAMIFFFIPVNIGRLMLSWLALTNQPVHDLYTVAAGLYICWLCARLAMLAREWAQKGWAYVKKLFGAVFWLIMRIVAASIPLLVIIPFMLGFYFQMLVISPLRVAIFQSPLFFPWKEWAMGVVHFKIICASVLMGPDWWLKTAFEQIYADGIWNFRLRDLYLNLVLPIINALALLIALPYALSKILLLFIEASREEQVIVTRYSYPFLLGSICTIAFLIWQWQKLKMLAQKIRNDKYLIGTQLVNFYRDNTPAAIQSTTNIPPKASPNVNEEIIEMGIEAQPQEAELMAPKPSEINGQEKLIAAEEMGQSSNKMT